LCDRRVGIPGKSCRSGRICRLICPVTTLGVGHFHPLLFHATNLFASPRSRPEVHSLRALLTQSMRASLTEHSGLNIASEPGACSDRADQRPVVSSEPCTMDDDMHSIFPNRHLKRRRLMPRRPHADIEFLFRRHDRISHGMARHDDCSESHGQQAGHQEAPSRGQLRPWSAFP
jgi:hypothetical protein